jgi:hypothetical protein
MLAPSFPNWKAEGEHLWMHPLPLSELESGRRASLKLALSFLEVAATTERSTRFHSLTVLRCWQDARRHA